MTIKLPQFRSLRRPNLLDRLGVGNTCLNEKIEEGLIPPGLTLFGGRAVGWPEHEIDQVLAAVVAGRSPDHIKTLVKELLTARDLADQHQEVNQ